MGTQKRFGSCEKGIDTSGMMFYDYGTFKGISIGAKDCKAPVRSTIQGDQRAIVVEKPASQMTEYKILYNDGFAEFIWMIKPACARLGDVPPIIKVWRTHLESLNACRLIGGGTFIVRARL